MTPTRRAIAAIGAAVLFIAACGDDDDGDANETAGTTNPDNSGDICDVIGDLDDLEDMEAAFTDPTELEPAMSDLRGLYEQAVDSAPDEIVDDLEFFNDKLVSLDEAFAEADYNVLDVQVSVISDLDDPELDAAGDRMEDFGESECGVEPDEDEDDEDSTNDFDEVVQSLPEDATLRDGMVQQFVNQGIDQSTAQCVADELEPDALEDEQQIVGAFENCGIDPQTGQPTGGT